MLQQPEPEPEPECTSKSKGRKEQDHESDIEIESKIDDEPVIAMPIKQAHSNSKVRTLQEEKCEHNKRFKEMEKRHNSWKLSSHFIDKDLMKNLMDKCKELHALPDNGPSDDSSLESSSSDDDSGSDILNVCKHKKSKKDKKKKKKMSSDTLVKLLRHLNIPKPDKYNGTPDYQKYLDFMSQLNNYLSFNGANELPDKLLIQISSQFLMGRAHKYYTSEVCKQPEEFEFWQFLWGILDAYFPANFMSTH